MPMAWYTCPSIRVIFQQIDLFVWSDHRSHFQTSVWMLSGISVNEAATNPHCHLIQAVAVLFDMYAWMCWASSNAPKPPPTANNIHCILKQMWNQAPCLLKYMCDKPHLLHFSSSELILQEFVLQVERNAELYFSFLPSQLHNSTV